VSPKGKMQMRTDGAAKRMYQHLTGIDLIGWFILVMSFWFAFG
jgi:hypothetical protein